MSLAKQLGATYQDRDKLISGVERHLLQRTFTVENDRRKDCIHPSEVSDENWCPRSTYYRMSGVEEAPVSHGLALEMVFETGHDAHRKWQGWFREMGVLRGRWACLTCGRKWLGISPKGCKRCGETRYELIKYLEVPVHNDDYLIAGHADGDVGPKLIEIKTIGTGTLRYDAPQLLKKYGYEHTDENGKVHTGTDWPALWAGIRRPFPKHIRQGMIYCFCTGHKSIVFIYDPKFLTGYPKEFEVQFDIEFIEEILRQCLIVKDCLAKERPPKRPIWADETSPICKKCGFKDVCYGSRIKDNRRDTPDKSATNRSKSGPAEERVEIKAKA